MDLDIDKAFLLGYAVDSNSKFIGWSSLFDYTSAESLRKSLQLPYPSGRRIDITLSTNDKVDVILTGDIITDVTKVLNVNKNKVTVGGQNKEYVDQLKNAVSAHEHTLISELNKSNSLKNFILSRIINIIQDARNFVSAYTPTSTDEIQEAADNSPKGKNANSYNLLDPLSLYHMQSENLVGKKVIGIGANGSKVQNLFNYFQNEMLRGDQTKQNRAKFNIQFNRILGRAYGNPKVADLNLTPGANIPNNVGNVKVLDPEITTDNASSQFISAATDNAKLLILSKINAGDKLAKCYVYLINLGFDYSDIVGFMTSPIVSFIDSITNSNIYCGNAGVQGVVNFALKNIKTLQGDDYKNVQFPAYWKMSDSYKNFIASQLHTLLKDNNNLEDLQEFSSILIGANEFTNASNNLSINQGIPTDKPSIDKKLNYLRDAFKYSKLNQSISETLKNSYGITDQTEIDNINEAIDSTLQDDGSKFDPKLWLRNAQVQTKSGKSYSYRDLARYVKEANKITINIFEMIEQLPHIKAMFDGLFIADFVTSLSAKTKLYDNVTNSVYCRGKIFKDTYLNRIESEIDKPLVYNFLASSSYRFPTNPQYKAQIINSAGNFEEFTENEIDLSTVLGQMRFKHYFETVFIPKLKAGKYFNGETEISNDSLIQNAFVNGLMLTVDPNGIPFYKLDMNMSQSDKVGSQSILYNKYKKGFAQLASMKVGNKDIADWFRLYSLIVNQGKNGDERLTKIIREYADDNSITSQYDQYLGEIDYPTFNIDQLQFSPLDVLISAAPVTNSTVSSSYPIVYFSGSDSIRAGYYYNGDELKIFPEISGESDVERSIRISNLKKYNVLNIYNVRTTQTLQECLGNLDSAETKNTLILSLRDMMKKGLISLTQNCK